MLGLRRLVVSLSSKCRQSYPGQFLRHPLSAHGPRQLQSSARSSKYTVSYQHGHDHGLGPALIGKTFGQILDEGAEKFPDEEYAVFTETGHRRTFLEFREEVDRLAAGLISLGVKRGDRLGIWGPNTLEWILTMYASTRIGAVLVNLNPAYQKNDIEYALNKVGVKTIIASPPFKTQNYYGMLADICPEIEGTSPGNLRSKRIPSLETVITYDTVQHPGTFLFSDVLDMGRSEHYDVIEDSKKRIQFDDVMNIQFTSGTTGSPKATCLTHFNILNNMVIFDSVFDGSRPGEVWLSPLPFFHTGGMCMATLGMLRHFKLIFPSASFDAGKSLQAIAHERCTTVAAVTTMFIDMVNHPDFNRFDTSTVTNLLTGGSDVSPNLRKRAEEQFNATMIVLYGMTEASMDVTAVKQSDPEYVRVNTVGHAAPWIEVKMVDPITNEIVPTNESGELCVRSPSVMTEYWGDEEKTKATIDHARWLHTGDLGKMDEDGYISIVGRKKEIIIRGGENIMPLQIEQLLQTHPKVHIAQVVGVPDERLGEELCLCVLLKAGEESTAQEIREFCKGKVAHYMVPRYVQFMESLPMTATGKVQKFKLQDDMKKRLNLQ